MASRIYLRNRDKSTWTGPYIVRDVININVWKAWMTVNLPLEDLIHHHQNGRFREILTTLRSAYNELEERKKAATVPIVNIWTFVTIEKYFFTVDFEWMVAKCEMLNLPKPTNPRAYQSTGPAPLTSPLDCVDVIGDGNCWFRSISYWVTGSEMHHSCIREALLDAYRNNNRIKRMVGDVEHHIAVNNIRMLGTWATEIEMMTTAIFLNVDIHVFSMISNKRTSWRLFGKSGSFRHGTKIDDKCLYLEHVNGQHFNVVMSVKPKPDETVVSCP